jgi:excisionase family DNA binding protein
MSRKKQTSTSVDADAINAVRVLMKQLGVDAKALQNQDSKPEQDQACRYLSMTEAAQYARLSRFTLARRIKDGQLRASKMSNAKSGRVLIALSDLENFIRSHRVKVQKEK